MDYIEKLNLQTEEVEETENLEKHIITNSEPFSVDEYEGHDRDFIAVGEEYNDGFNQLKETNGLGISCIVSKEVKEARKDVNGIYHEKLKDRINSEVNGLNERIDSEVNNLNSSLDNIETELEKTSNVPKKLDNEKDDTESIQRLIDQDKKINFEKGKTYYVSSLKVKKDTRIDGCGATIRCNTDNVNVFSYDGNDAPYTYLKNISIDLTDTPNSIGIYGDYWSGSTFENLSIRGGLKGIEYNRGYNVTFKKINISDFSKVGFEWNGDNGAELSIDYMYIASNNINSEKGFLITRTTPEDVGGYYLKDVLCLGGINKRMKEGFICLSKSTTPSTLALELIGGGADMISDNGMVFENVANIRTTSLWVVGGNGTTTKSIKIKNSELLSFMNSQIPGGYLLEGTIKGLTSVGNTIGLAQAYTVNNYISFQRFMLQDTYNDFSNNTSVLSKAITTISYTLPSRFLISPTLSTGALAFVNGDDTNKAKFLRINNSNEMVLLNSTFTDDLFILDNWGNLKTWGGLKPGKGNVGLFGGTGSPENSVMAAVGSLYMQEGVGLWLKKTNGVSKTGWVLLNL